MKEKLLVSKLIKKQYYIASAESCTGGMFASTVINVPNASNVLKASIVTYSNEAKQKYCNVKKETINKFGVVSEEVASEMALGIANECGANVGVSFTGLAGPMGDGILPVGTVCFGFCINGKVTTTTKVFSGGRQKVRKKCVKYAINQLLCML